MIYPTQGIVFKKKKKKENYYSVNYLRKIFKNKNKKVVVLLTLHV